LRRSAIGRDNLPDPLDDDENPYLPRSMPVISDLFDMFDFDRSHDQSRTGRPRPSVQAPSAPLEWRLGYAGRYTRRATGSGETGRGDDAGALGWALSFLIAMQLALVLPAAAERSVAEDLPRSYASSFQWDGTAEPQSAVMSLPTINGVSIDTVAAEGCGVYNARGRVTTIRVKMGLPDLAVTIAELDPIDAGGFVVDGRHKAISRRISKQSTRPGRRARPGSTVGCGCMPPPGSNTSRCTTAWASMRSSR